MRYPIRLLLISKSTGGVATYIHLLLKGLDRSKFDITVGCLSENSREFASELISQYGVQAFSLDMNRYKINPFTDARVLLRLRAHLRINKYDLIHAHASKPGFLVRLAAVCSGVPVIYSPHNFAFHEGSHPIVTRIVVVLEKMAAQFTGHIITVSNHERDLGLKYGVGTPNLYSVVPTGMDLSPFRMEIDKAELKSALGIPQDVKVVGAVGRLAIPKMPEDFVRVAAQIHQDYPDLHFVWVGSGPLEERAINLSQRLGLANVFHWLGHRTDINQIYRIFDCFVLLSRWEANPLVILEAFASGIPVVAYDNMGTRELISKAGHGVLVPIGDILATAESIRAALDQMDDKHSGVVSTSAFERISKLFSFDSMIDSIEKIYFEKAISL